MTPFWNVVIETLKRADLGLVAGQYTEAPDLNPLIGATPLEGLWLNTAYGGHGVMMSPAGARLCVDLLTGKLAAAANPFRATRFADGSYQPGEKMVL